MRVRKPIASEGGEILVQLWGEHNHAIRNEEHWQTELTLYSDEDLKQWMAVNGSHWT